MQYRGENSEKSGNIIWHIICTYYTHLWWACGVLSRQVLWWHNSYKQDTTLKHTVWIYTSISWLEKH